MNKKRMLFNSIYFAAAAAFLIIFSGVGAMAQNEVSKVTQSTTSQEAIVAGGCFWGMEELIRKQPGVTGVLVGYTGGTLVNPKYEDTHDGKSGHAEAVKITFDATKTSYQALLHFFFRIHDPTTLNRQGNDRGSQYRSAIFYLSPEQEAIAQKVKAEVDASKKWPNPIVTEITAATTFYPAEDYHQDYLQKHPDGYTCHFIRD